MNTRKSNSAEPGDCPWEAGELGRDANHVAVVEDAATWQSDEALELQMISIRLEKGLLHDLKEVAAFHGIGYQPMIRDLLHRFVRAELTTILNQRLKEIEQEIKRSTGTVPVDDFMNRRRA
jgi:hypothetical protein